MSSPTPSRRALLTASAWTVPAVVLATSAPAFATSGDAPLRCEDASYFYNWAGSGWTYQSTQAVTAGTRAGVGFGYAGVVNAPAPGVSSDPVKVTVANSFSGSMVGLVNSSGKNMVVPTHHVGGLETRGLELYQGISTGKARSVGAERRLDSQTLKVTFDRPVSNVSFSITDIDFTVGQYSDRVEIAVPVPYTAVPTSKATVLGAGTQSSPWRGAYSGGNVDHVTDSRGNVAVTFNGTVSEFTLRFWNADGGSQSQALTAKGAQAIFLSNFTFRASTCAPQG